MVIVVDSVANSAVFPRNWVCFRTVLREKISGCGFVRFFLCTCRYFWASTKSGDFYIIIILSQEPSYSI